MPARGRQSRSVDLQLNDDGTALVMVKGDFVLATGRDAITQHLRIRLRTFRGEWFLDRRVGLPYYQQILVKGPNLAAVKALYRRAIMETPGVTELRHLEVTMDHATRSAAVAFGVETIDGPVELTEEMIL